MVVPPALQSSVVFKSLQVIFAVLIVHFMLKITGAYGRNTMIAAAFVMAVVMIGGLGYLVDIHVLVDGDLSVRQGHAIAHAVKGALIAAPLSVTNVAVHIEPAVAPEPPG